MRPALLLALAAGCSPVEGLGDDTPLLDATLRRVHLRGVTVLGGAFGGDADFEIETPAGERTIPVRLRGSAAGLGVELAALSHGTFDAVVPEGAVVDDLFGRYHGSAAQIAVLVGFEVHHLKNDAGIELHGPATTGAVALMWGAEWMTIDPLNTVIPEPTDPEVTP